MLERLTRQDKKGVVYDSDISSETFNDNYLYVGVTTTNKVYKLNKSDLSKVTESLACGDKNY